MYDYFRQHWIVKRRYFGSRLHPRLDARLLRPHNVREHAGARLEILCGVLRVTRASIEHPDGRMLSWPSERFSPAACLTIHSTKSMPVTSSVTPCSTWRRVLTSRKKKSQVPLS